MNKLKALLLPIAIVFGAIAIFETGARYGATNMRAYAISQQLHSLTQIRISIQNEKNENTQVPVVPIDQIDNLIASGSMLREIWHLSTNAKETLNNTLAFVLQARGCENVINRLKQARESEGTNDDDQKQFDAIIAAIQLAQIELIDKAINIKETVDDVSENDSFKESAQ
ncbi:MAG: hypothetical protein VXX82_07665 [Verrucomicrobiota bacterium]|nr:hypothetical protein [Verrucomicrobiota bacterium]MEC8650790.1 hypothetical protein [Verrucomicrobiota bacterium]